jgi:glucose/arabinose dehydrogenase
MRNLILLFALFFSIKTISQPVLSFNRVINTGLNAAVDVVTANDGTNRIFIAERGGTIKVYNSSYTLLNNNFLTISTNFSSGGERGLLSLVFHPDYENNRFFFVYYTNAAGGINIDRFQASTTNANAADASTQTNIMTIVKPVSFSNHNGGKLNFGPDGNLYFALGDGGSGGDPRNFAQRGDSLWGKMVRINVNNFTTPPYYTIPADNPFMSDPAILDEIFALGLRNPWRWSFDKLNGNVWIADVGQDAKEEVNKITSALASGANFGWRCYEGIPISTSSAAGCQTPSSYISPIFDYPHNPTNGGYSITGGYVYRGSLYPAMVGYYICADYVTGNAWVINSVTNAALIQTGVPTSIASFAELENGELIALTLTGSLYTVTSNTVLPLQLLNFSGQKQNGFNIFSWQTANENQVASFEIERSFDALLFEKIATVSAKNIAQATYTFKQLSTQNRKAFYRLKMINNDGVYKYSNILEIQQNDTKNRTIIQNYNGNSKLVWLNVDNSEKVSFQLYTLTGQNVLSISNYKQNAIIDLQKHAAGIYVGKIIEGEKTQSEKIILR